MQMPSGRLALYARIVDQQWQTVKGYAKRAITIKSEMASLERKSYTAVLKGARIVIFHLHLACGKDRGA